MKALAAVRRPSTRQLHGLGSDICWLPIGLLKWQASQLIYSYVHLPLTLVGHLDRCAASPSHEFQLAEENKIGLNAGFSCPLQLCIQPANLSCCSFHLGASDMRDVSQGLGSSGNSEKGSVPAKHVTLAVTLTVSEIFKL